MNAVLAALEARVKQIEARVARLDQHSSEIAGELLDVIERLDRLATEQEATARALADHDLDHWRQGR